MLEKKYRYSALILVWMLSTIAYGDINVKKGMWEINNHTKVSGLPMKIPDTKILQCIDAQSIIPKADKKINKYCKIIEQKIVGDTVSWKMQCTHKMQSHGSITYHGKTFDGIVTTSTKVPHIGSMTMTNHITGRRTGECK